MEIDVHGVPVKNTGQSFHVHTVRRNPSISGQVTGSATLASFFSSVLSKFHRNYACCFLEYQMSTHAVEHKNFTAFIIVFLDFMFHQSADFAVPNIQTV